MKNILYSNQKNPKLSYKGFYLSGLAILLLGGCDMTNFMDNMTGARSDQQVIGGRRIPNLNPRRAVSTKAEAASEQVKTQQQTANTPYDMYDANGNEIVKSSKESTDAGNDTGTFSKFIDSNFSAPKQPAVTETKPLPLGKEITQDKFTTPALKANDSIPQNPNTQLGHKPLAGNPYSPEGLMITPLTETKLTETKIEEIKTTEKPTEKFKDIEVTNNSNINLDTPKLEVPKEEIKAETKTEAKEDFFDRIGSYFTFDSKEEPKKEAAESDYPKISSVPPKPEEFEIIKRDQQQNFNELKLEHKVAEQEKLSLESEVSGELPVKSSPSLTQPINTVVTEKKKEEVKQESKSSLKQPSFEEKIIALPTPTLDEEISKKDAPVAFIEESKPVIEQPAFYQNDTLPPVTEVKSADKPSDTLLPFTETKSIEKSEEKPSYFDNLVNSLSEEFNSKPDSKASVIENSAIIEPSPALGNTNTSNVDNKIEINSDVKTTEILPILKVEKKEETSSPESSFEPASKVIGNIPSLPSPEIIKTIPPSRYEGLRSKSNSAY